MLTGRLSEAPEYKERMDAALRRANVVCIVYAVNNPTSFERITSHWLPLLRQLGVNVPVVLVGTKIDVRGADLHNPHLENDMLPIMSNWKVRLTFVP